MQPYKVSLSTKLKSPQSGTIVIEPEDYTKDEVRALKASGARVLAYLSIGSTSTDRKYYEQLEPYLLDRLKDWKKERYLDLRQPAARTWCQKQAKSYKDKGFDGYWLDNVDVYEEYRTTAMFDAVTKTIQAIKAVGGYVMLNGGMMYLTDLLIPHKAQVGAYKVKKNAKKIESSLKAKGFKTAIIEMDDMYKVQVGAFSLQAGADQAVKKLTEAGFTGKRITLFDGRASAFINAVNQEEVFSLIEDYGGSGEFGKQTREESEKYQSHMRRLVKNGIEGFLLEYTEDNTLKSRIKAFCDVHGMSGCCISGDKDL